MPTNDERRKVAGLLREMAGATTGLSDGEFVDLVEEIVFDGDVSTDAEFLNHLADLIDPTEHERTVADNLALIDRNRELEIELVRVKRDLAEAHRRQDD